MFKPDRPQKDPSCADREMVRGRFAAESAGPCRWRSLFTNRTDSSTETASQSERQHMPVEGEGGHGVIAGRRGSRCICPRRDRVMNEVVGTFGADFAEFSFEHVWTALKSRMKALPSGPEGFHIAEEGISIRLGTCAAV